MSEGQVSGAGPREAEIEEAGERWLLQARRHCDRYVARFNASLQAISAAISEQQGDERVLIRHVDEAHQTLSRAGLSRLSWINRPENETAAGGLLIGAAVAANDVLGVFLKDGEFRAGAAVVWVILFFVAGVFLYFHGMHRSYLPDGRESIVTRTLNWVKTTANWAFGPVRQPAQNLARLNILTAMALVLVFAFAWNKTQENRQLAIDLQQAKAASLPIPTATGDLYGEQVGQVIAIRGEIEVIAGQEKAVYIVVPAKNGTKGRYSMAPKSKI